MRKRATTLIGLFLMACLTTPVLAQEEGDYRTRDSGDWSNPQIWQVFNGSAWVAVATPPTGSETITIVADAEQEREDSVFVDVETIITGRVVNQGRLEAEGNFTVGDGGVYEHARDEGNVPIATWAEGSTLLMSGTVSTAPANRRQNYHHIVFDSPGLLSNVNMDLDSVTVSGDIRVVNTNLARWYLTSAEAEESSTVEILGDVIVEDGAFSVHGTSNALTTFEVHHYGDIIVTGGNFSISRGSQGGGTTKWYLYGGDFEISNATTQNSNLTPGGARFVFAGDEEQTLTVGEGVEMNSFPIEVASGAALDIGQSTFGGSGDLVVREGGTLATAAPGGLAGIFGPEYVGSDTLEVNSSYVFNGTDAQVTSELLPVEVMNLTINNEAGVTLTQATTINGQLVLQAGVFDNTVPFTLGPDAEIIEEGGSLADPVSSEGLSEIPHSIFVEQNFPNPFNPSTVIRYGLPAASDVTVRIFNLLGQEVAALSEGQKSAGVHEFTFDARGLSSGMYIYRIEAGDLSVARTMILVE